MSRDGTGMASVGLLKNKNKTMEWPECSFKVPAFLSLFTVQQSHHGKHLVLHHHVRFHSQMESVSMATVWSTLLMNHLQPQELLQSEIHSHHNYHACVSRWAAKVVWVLFVHGHTGNLRQNPGRNTSLQSPDLVLKAQSFPQTAQLAAHLWSAAGKGWHSKSFQLMLLA